VDERDINNCRDRQSDSLCIISRDKSRMKKRLAVIQKRATLSTTHFLPHTFVVTRSREAHRHQTLPLATNNCQERLREPSKIDALLFQTFERLSDSFLFP
jgi:hypothetical protein